MTKNFNQSTEIVLEMVPKNHQEQPDYYPIADEDRQVIVTNLDDGIKMLIEIIDDYIRDFGENAPYGGDMSAIQVKEKLLSRDYKLSTLYTTTITVFS